MKILVTGANGFVGKALLEELKKRNIAYKGAVRYKNKSLNDGFVEVGKINDKTDWEYALQDVNVVIHLAARVHIMNDQSTDLLAAFNSVNAGGTQNLATQAVKANVKRFIYVSSIKVNGEFTENQSFSEASEPNPQDPYAISKMEAEKTLREIERETGMEVVILRPPLVYGASVKANFASLLSVVNKKLPLPLASVVSKRSLVYVGNLADAIIVCASNPKAAGQTYLLSDGEDVSMPQLIKKIAHALNKPSYLLPFPVLFIRLIARVFGKVSSVDRLTQSLQIDSSKIRQQLDWTPPFTMDQGLKVTADWYLNSIKKDHL